MIWCVRTTIRIRDKLLNRAKKKAVEEGRSLTSLVEEGLMIALSKSNTAKRERIRVPVSKELGGVLPGVDLNRSSNLEDFMKES